MGDGDDLVGRPPGGPECDPFDIRDEGGGEHIQSSAAPHRIREGKRARFGHEEVGAGVVVAALPARPVVYDLSATFESATGATMMRTAGSLSAVISGASSTPMIGHPASITSAWLLPLAKLHFPDTE